ncbi:MAG TPA: flagellar hook-basal body complex protein FliE [Lachnospiraceae bacterium]|nr:flagellar hook-basal body complex protein FliE [Lachnospiraceae bacterium]
MDISSLYNVSSGIIKSAAENSSLSKTATSGETQDMFGSILHSAMESLNTTNSYLSDAENEKIKLALGETDNTHDLTIALQKASTALQYTVAIRDKFLEAYKEIMQIQI